MGHLEYLITVLILLATSVVIVVTSKKLRLSPVLGYLITGVLFSKFEVISDTEAVEIFSEVGVIFLLFVIGLELTFERLIKMRLHVFGFGSLQIIITTVLITIGIEYFLDYAFNTALVIAAALALSSTAIVLQVLAESKKQATQVGRLSISNLIMQDFAVVPLLTIVPLLDASGTTADIMTNIGVSALKALVFIIIATVVGRLILRPIFSVIGSVKSEEVYIAMTLFMVLGAATFTKYLSLSEGMGAFIAGLLIAETEYRGKVEDIILPFKSLLLGLFFMVVGMKIDLQLIISNWQDVLAVSILLLIIKAIVIFLLCLLFRFRVGASLHTALLMAQGGEFAFILFNEALGHKVLSENIAQFLQMVVAVTMAVTPLLSIIGSKLEELLDWKVECASNKEFKEISDLDSHVIVAGFGRVGRVVASALAMHQLQYIAIDSNAALVKKARKQGFPVFHGDLSREEIAQSLGLDRAKAVILTMSEKSSIRKSVKALATMYPNLNIVTRVEDYRHGMRLKKLGSKVNIPSTIETGLQLAGASLTYLGVTESQILDMKEKFRKNEYSITEEMELFRGISPTNIIE